MKNVKNYMFPADAGEALKMLLDKKLKSSLIAGGTLAVKSIPETVETLVDISRLEKYVKMSGKNLVLGAFETFDRLENSRLAGNWAGGVISKAASKCSSQLIRNMATVGGNIARPNAFNVLPPVFTALDAVVRVETGTGQKNFGLEDIYSDDFKYALGRDSIIKEVVIPAKTRNWKCAFEKFAKTLSCWESYVTFVSALDIKGGVVLTARLVLGALAARPVRVKSAERAITGRKLSAETAESAVNALACEMDGMRIPPNHLEFKKQIAVSIFKRMITQITDRDYAD